MKSPDNFIPFINYVQRALWFSCSCPSGNVQIPDDLHIAEEFAGGKDYFSSFNLLFVLCSVLLVEIFTAHPCSWHCPPSPLLHPTSIAFAAEMMQSDTRLLCAGQQSMAALDRKELAISQRLYKGMEFQLTLTWE